MHSRIEDGKARVTLDMSIEFDPASCGYVVCEKDGPAEISHELRWGPMPLSLAEAYVEDRCSSFRKAVRIMVDGARARLFAPDGFDLRPGAVNRVDM